MPRTVRKTPGGYIYHVLNRGNGRLRIFKKRDDFLAFEKILGQAQERFDMRICGYCLMSNHWHLLLWPKNDGDLSRFMQWLTVTHTMRFHYSHGTAGMGHVYQGRFKSFPVQSGRHYVKVLRYIESNPLRAKLVTDAGKYAWSSYRCHIAKLSEQKQFTINEGPEIIPPCWERLVHEPMPQSNTDKIAVAMKRSSPLGDDKWEIKTAETLNLKSTLVPRGRPKKET